MKQIEANTPLQSAIIDAMWGYKIGEDIDGLHENTQLRYWLAEEGLDVAAWRSKQEKRARGRQKQVERQLRRELKAWHSRLVYEFAQMQSVLRNFNQCHLVQSVERK